MTEAEWLACKEPARMLRFIRLRASDRKLRLFGSSCYRNWWTTSPVSTIHWDVLQASESYADGQIAKHEFRQIRKRLGGYNNPHVSGMAEQVAYGSSSECLGQTWVPDGESVGLAGHVLRSRPEQLGPQCHSIRDIFGNPFRPTTFSPEWGTDTAVTLARQMYDAREFSAMPILADALQDAGCDNPDILDHCRDASQVHVRGCWVVDLVLEKS